MNNIGRELSILWERGIRKEGMSLDDRREATQTLIDSIGKCSGKAGNVDELCQWGVCFLQNQGDLSSVIASLGDFEHQSLILIAVNSICKISHRTGHTADLRGLHFGDKLVGLARSYIKLRSEEIRMILNGINGSQKSGVISLALKTVEWNNRKYEAHTCKEGLWIDFNLASISWNLKEEDGETVVLDVRHDSIKDWKVHKEGHSWFVSIAIGINSPNIVRLWPSDENDSEKITMLLQGRGHCKKMISKTAGIDLEEERSLEQQPPSIRQNVQSSSIGADGIIMESSCPPPLGASSSELALITQNGDRSVDGNVFIEKSPSLKAKSSPGLKRALEAFHNEFVTKKMQKVIKKTVKRYLRIRRKHFKGFCCLFESPRSFRRSDAMEILYQDHVIPETATMPSDESIWPILRGIFTFPISIASSMGTIH